MSTVLTAPRLPAAALRAGASTGAPAPEGARGLSALLLAAAIATLIVVADQVIDAWADGHLMLAWVLLWAVVFAGLALFADSARRIARRGMVALDTWSRSLGRPAALNRASAAAWVIQPCTGRRGDASSPGRRSYCGPDQEFFTTSQP